jgi:hypothetical protein
MDSFSPETITQLKTYVYRLIDPRNGETFYVGKGSGNRVFEHVKAKIGSDDTSLKLRRIHEIQVAGLEVAHVIHRHGLDNATAFEVEAALIDAYPGLTNAVNGLGSNEYGAMHANEIVKKYQAELAMFRHRAILINVNRSATDTSLYEATRYAWKISQNKASRSQIVCSVRFGIIIAVFVADRWLPATTENFPGREPIIDRYGFEGHEAPETVQKLYRGKRVPDEFRKKGAANPIKYTFK